MRETSGCGGCVHPTATFYDGLGQVLQTKTESQNGSEMIVTDTRYNALGLAQDQYAPYKLNNATTFWNFVSLNPAQPKTNMIYDALGRVTKVTQPDNSTVESIYNGRRTAVIDALGQQTIQEVDAFGRLAQPGSTAAATPRIRRRRAGMMRLTPRQPTPTMCATSWRR